MECRVGCGACCIAPSISSPLPGMPLGKPAGVRCVNLNSNHQCTIWGSAQFPKVCQTFKPSAWVCGDSTDDALTLLAELETLTTPKT
jgi:uncharacterized protein